MNTFPFHLNLTTSLISILLFPLPRHLLSPNFPPSYMILSHLISSLHSWEWQISFPSFPSPTLQHDCPLLNIGQHNSTCPHILLPILIQGMSPFSLPWHDWPLRPPRVRRAARASEASPLWTARKLQQPFLKVLQGRQVSLLVLWWSHTCHFTPVVPSIASSS